MFFVNLLVTLALLLGVRGAVPVDDAVERIPFEEEATLRAENERRRLQYYPSMISQDTYACQVFFQHNVIPALCHVTYYQSICPYTCLGGPVEHTKPCLLGNGA